MSATRLLSSTALTAAVIALAAPAAAQGQIAVEEIVVTARKTTERLQEVPISISAYSSAELTERGLNDVFRLSQFTPGFSFEKVNRYGVQGGTSRPVIRGMSNILGEGNAALFVDGALYTDSILSFPFDIVERVEIIKGPQAALFGRATFSGAINLITKKGTNEFENKITAKAAEYNNYELNLLSRGPIMEDKLFYMAHARWYTLGHQYRNRIDGRGVGQERSYGANGSLEFRPTDQLSATISLGYNKDEDGMAAIALQDRFSNNCFLNTTTQYYCGQVIRQESVAADIAGLEGNEGLDRKSTRVSATIVYDADDFTVTSHTGAFFTKQRYGYDSTFQGATTSFYGGLIPGSTIEPRVLFPSATRAATDPVRVRSTQRLEVSEKDEWSTELRVQSASENRFRFLGGAFYYQRRRPLEERHFAVTAPTIDFGTDRVDNWALFGSAEADLTEAWEVRAELRYAQDKIGNFKRTVTVGGVTTNNLLVERKFKSWSPRFSTNYQFSESTMVYATVAKGNKPGVINADPRFPPDIQFAREESSWNYEVGTKNTLLDGRLIVNAAFYFIDWKDQQLTTTFNFPTGGTQSYIVNAGKTHVKGLEFEISGVFNEYLSGGFTYALNDAKFREFNDPEAGRLFGNQSVRGFQLPNQPKHQATLYGKVNYPVTDEINAFFRADAAYNERKFDQIYNLAYGGDQYLLNLKLGVETETWNFTVFVDNVTDDRTPSTVVRYVDQLNLNVGPNVNSALNNVAGSSTQERAFQYPLADKRRFGVTASYKF